MLVEGVVSELEELVVVMDGLESEAEEMGMGDSRGSREELEVEETNFAGRQGVPDGGRPGCPLPTWTD